MGYALAAFCGFFGFLLGCYLTVLGLWPSTGEDRAIELLLAAGVAGSVLAPALLWRYRAALAQKNERQLTAIRYALAAIAGFFAVFTATWWLVVYRLWPDMAIEISREVLVLAGMVGSVVAVLLMRGYAE